MIRLIVLDVDGVLTDGGIHIGPQGESHKSFDVKDGAGIVEWLRDGELAIVTGRESAIVRHRASELGVEEVRQDVSDKLAVVEELAESHSLSLEEVAFVGDDASDTEALAAVGIAAVPADATIEAKQAADMVLNNSGGRGAVRELINSIRWADKQVLGVIPARYGSTRFPGKPLAEIAGKSMIRRVYENASAATELDELVVATDDERISDAVTEFGGTAVMTSSEHESGTDRVAEVATNGGADIVVNIQGDEPLIDPEAIDATVRELRDAPASISTPISPISDPDELEDSNTVKVVTNTAGEALYFSRSRIPSNGDIEETYKHIGLYAFERELLSEYVTMDSSLERAEDLEQLRLLENGYDIQTVEVLYDPKEVNVEADIQTVEAAIQE